MNVVCIDSSEHSERAFQCEYIYLQNILCLPIYHISTGGENSTINMNVNSLVFHRGQLLLCDQTGFYLLVCSVLLLPLVPSVANNTARFYIVI